VLLMHLTNLKVFETLNFTLFPDWAFQLPFVPQVILSSLSYRCYHVSVIPV